MCWFVSKLLFLPGNNIKLGPGETVLGVISRSPRIDTKAWKHVGQGERSKSEALFHLFGSLANIICLPGLPGGYITVICKVEQKCNTASVFIVSTEYSIDLDFAINENSTCHIQFFI